MLCANPAAVRCGEITGRQIRHHLVRSFNVACRVHAERSKDAPVKKLAQRLAADLLHDVAEQHEVGVAVEIAGPRHEVQPALPADAVQQVTRFAGLAKISAAEAHDLQHVADAGGVVHQVRERDAMAEIGQRRNVTADIVLDRQPAFGGQQQDRGAGELLADRAMRNVVWVPIGKPNSRLAMPALSCTTRWSLRTIPIVTPGVSLRPRVREGAWSGDAEVTDQGQSCAIGHSIGFRDEAFRSADTSRRRSRRKSNSSRATGRETAHAQYCDVSCGAVASCAGWTIYVTARHAAFPDARMLTERENLVSR